MGSDDWLALLYLLKHPDVSLQAITTTGVGLSHSPYGAENALKLISLAGIEKHSIQVAYGDNEPEDGYHTFPIEWKHIADKMFDLDVPESSYSPSPFPAADLIIRLLRSSPVPVKILTLGNLTNIYQAMEKDPSIKTKIDRIYIMGGAIDVKGNIIINGATDHLSNQFAEWNIYLDPIAAKAVFHSGVRITLIPLDVTNTVQITNKFAKKLKNLAKSPAAKFWDQILDIDKEFVNSGNFYFWDPLAAAVVADSSSSLFEFGEEYLDVVVKYTTEHPTYPLAKYSTLRKNGQKRKHFDPHLAGQIIRSSNGAKVTVCKKIMQPDMFKDQLIEVLNS